MLTWRRGHDRILQVIHPRHPVPHLWERLEEGARLAGFAPDDDRLVTLAMEDLREAPESVQRRVAEFAPTAIIGQCDYYLRLLEELCPETVALDRIGCFDTQHSKRPGHEFSSYRIDFGDVWRQAAEAFDGPPRVVEIAPELVARWPAREREEPDKEATCGG
jgi:hypothetical protein